MIPSAARKESGAERFIVRRDGSTIVANGLLEPDTIYEVIRLLVEYEPNARAATIVCLDCKAPNTFNYLDYASNIALKGWLDLLPSGSKVAARLESQTDMAGLLTYLCFDRRTATDMASVRFDLGLSGEMMRHMGDGIIHSTLDGSTDIELDLFATFSSLVSFVVARTSINEEQLIHLFELTAETEGKELWSLGICNDS